MADYADAKVLFDRGILFRELGEITKNAPKLRPLWGNYFFRQAVTTAIGDPGVSKTTFTYEMLTRITEGKSFLNIVPTEEVIAVELDYESGDSLIAVRSDRLGISEDKHFKNLRIFNYGEFSVEILVPLLKEFHKQFPFNLLVIDNQLTAFNTHDENDNAEASTKIKLVRKLAIELDCAIVVFHHPSKANQDGTRKGSGAFAWSRHADICLNFNATTEEGVVEIDIVKNRIVEDKTPLYYRLMGEGKFDISDAPTGSKRTATQIDNVQRCILEQHGQWERGELVKVVEKITGESTSLIDKGLRTLKYSGRIKNPIWGRYNVP